MDTGIESIEVQEFVCRFKDLVENKNAKFCFFLGAGCSVSSGIPTAGTLVENVWLPKLKELKTKNQENFDEWFKKRFSDYDKNNAAQFYGDVIEKLFLTPKERQQEIERLVAKKDPGFGYAVLAQLLAEKCGEHCNIILTTNFDDMVADALYLYTNKKPIVIFHESLAGFVKISDTRPLVIKLHGDSKLSPLNTKKETKELDNKVKKVIKNLLSEAGLIFIGYGGNDKSITDILKEVPEDEGSFQWGIYWVGQKIPQNEMGEFLEDRNAIWVNHRDFDELMLLINEEFGLKSPSKDRFDRLFNNFLDTFQNLRDNIYSKPTSGEKEILEKAVENISQGFESWWLVELEAARHKFKNPNKTDQIYQEGIKQFPNNYMLLNNYANFLCKVRRDYDKPKELFRTALELDPKNAAINGNYAIFLHYFIKDYDKAEKYYEESLELYAENATIIENYAIFLYNVRKNYEKAEWFYKKALEIEPENVNKLGNYSGFLLSRGNEEKGFELLKKAISSADDQSLLLEFWFYCYAHTKDEKSRNQSLNKIKEFIKSGVNSPAWNFDENVKVAIKDGHPEPKFLEKLSGVITNEIDAKELDYFDVWLQNP